MSSDYSNSPQPPTSLTPVERQTLLLLHQVLSHMDTGEGDHHKNMIEVLSEGFTYEYDNVFALFPELTRADCRLVYDILNMFSTMKTSLARLPEDERTSLTSDFSLVVTYRGLDYNDTREGKMAGYVTFLQQKAGRWTDLIEDVMAADGGNSHMPMLASYEAMLDVYGPAYAEVSGGVASTYLLSSEQIRRIGEARA